MKLFQFGFLIFSLQLINISGLKILGILPFGVKSHWAVGHSIIKALVDAGHEATVVSPFPLKTPIENYKEINITDILKAFDTGMIIFSFI